MADFNTFINSLRAEFGEQDAGKKFEVFCKWFLENDPEWSKVVERVWLFADYPDKWQRQDLGTDLVFRDYEGQVWAVQAKCYSEHRSTTKADMNSFLADSSRKGVDKRLWLQTTNKMEQKAEKTLKGQDKPTTVFKLNDFQKAHLEYPDSFAELYQAKPKPKPTPDLHQKEAIKAVIKGFQTEERGQMIMACGTGKTFTTLWIKEALNAQTTLVLLPSLNLLSQTMREWAWGAKDGFDILNVCSDKSVGRRAEDMGVSEAPFPVTSEVEEIAAFLKKPTKKVLFCTYQSSPLIAEVQQDTSIPSFDLTIADEAHRCAGKSDAGFSTILDEAKIRSDKRLFTTATPRYFGKAIRDAAKLRDTEIIGMDNEELFGQVIHKLTFGKAIQRDLLNDYQVVVVGVDEPRVKLLIDNYELVSSNPDNITDARTLAAKLGLIKAIQDYDLKRVISFHSRVKGAKEFSSEFTDVVKLIKPDERPEGLFFTDFVEGKMKAGERLDKIQKLKSLHGFDRGVMSNAKCLAEGVDVPSLDGIAFIDPKGSQVEIIQAVGRAIRKVRNAKSQSKGTIVIPVFIEEGDSPEASIEASNFKPVWDILNALRAHDEILAETLDEYRANLARDKHSARSDIGKIIFDLPKSVGMEFASALQTVLVEASTASWEFWFAKLQQYKEENGDCLVRDKLRTRDGYGLGSWVGKQRSKKSTLSPEKIRRLEEIGFVWDPISEQWEQGFAALCQYKEENGDCLVRDKLRTRDGYGLGTWVSTQRSKKSTLSPEKIRRLEEIGFVWDPISEQWEQGFAALCQYKEENGDCLVRDKLRTRDGYGLGTWVSTQRSKKSTLSSEKIRRLEEIGFVWDPISEQWEQGFAALCQYKEENGDCLVRSKLRTRDGYGLGTWVGKQRSKKSTLSPEKIRRLEEIGFVWDPISEQWEQGFAALCQYKEENGDCLVRDKLRTRDGYGLGSWVGKQRSKKSTLSSEKIRRLEEIGFVWDARKIKKQ